MAYLLQLLLRVPQGAGHDLLRAIPVPLQGQEILPGQLALLIALDHADLLRHVEGEDGVFHALRTAGWVMDKNVRDCIIVIFGKAIFTHPGEPFMIRGFYFRKLVQFPGGNGGAVVVISNFNQFVHCDTSKKFQSDSITCLRRLYRAP
mgnify:CR=1 FL=1